MCVPVSILVLLEAINLNTNIYLCQYVAMLWRFFLSVKKFSIFFFFFFGEEKTIYIYIYIYYLNLLCIYDLMTVIP